MVYQHNTDSRHQAICKKVGKMRVCENLSRYTFVHIAMPIYVQCCSINKYNLERRPNLTMPHISFIFTSVNPRAKVFTHKYKE